MMSEAKAPSTSPPTRRGQAARPKLELFLTSLPEALDRETLQRRMMTADTESAKLFNPAELKRPIDFAEGPADTPPLLVEPELHMEELMATLLTGLCDSATPLA